MKMDRSKISVVTFEESEKQQLQESLAMTPQERFAHMTYLRESFYGPEATTGRVQRVFEVTQQKRR